MDRGEVQVDPAQEDEDARDSSRESISREMVGRPVQGKQEGTRPTAAEATAGLQDPGQQADLRAPWEAVLPALPQQEERLLLEPPLPRLLCG